MAADALSEKPILPSRQRLVLVTGPSGAGRSTAIRVLEDLGYEAIDNMPMSLIQSLLEGLPLNKSIALGIDTRNRDFSTAALIDVIEQMSQFHDTPLEVLYLDCRADVLQKRYSETRRRHPMAPRESPELGIEREFELLGPIKARADILIDSSDLTPHQLGVEVKRWLAPTSGQSLAISVNSFSYKRGLPRGMDMVFDVRFLRNPYWDDSLRLLNGHDARVAEYVEQDTRCEPFFERIMDLTKMLLPAYIEEGKAHFAIGFGCTGGQHRSVTVAEKMAKALAVVGWQVSIRHRELERK